MFTDDESCESNWCEQLDFIKKLIGDGQGPLRHESEECDCNCHTDGREHIDACCHGRCEGCGIFMALGHGSHRWTCEKWFEWAKKQKRKYLRERKLWDYFESAKVWYKMDKPARNIAPPGRKGDNGHDICDGP